MAASPRFIDTLALLNELGGGERLVFVNTGNMAVNFMLKVTVVYTQRDWLAGILAFLARAC